jgi:hypothetical protein
VYDRPLLLPTDVTIKSQDEVESIILTASTSIIFNLALSCHQQGTITGNEILLKKAARLYALVVRILDNADSDDEVHYVLKCLALNNGAQLHYEQCDYDLSQICMEEMFHLLMQTDCLLDDFLEADEADQVRLNMLHLQLPSVARAA